MPSHWFKKKGENMIGCPPFLLLWVTHFFCWCNTNTVIPCIIPSPSLSFVLTRLIRSVSLSPLHFFSPLSIFRRIALIVYTFFLIFLVCLLYLKKSFFVSCCFTFLYRSADLYSSESCLQRALGPTVSGSVGHAEKKSLRSFFLSLVPDSHISEAHEDNLTAYSKTKKECSALFPYRRAVNMQSD